MCFCVCVEIDFFVWLWFFRWVFFFNRLGDDNLAGDKCNMLPYMHLDIILYVLFLKIS